MSHLLSPAQERVNTAKELFNKAFISTVATNAINSISNPTSSPRHNTYKVLLERKTTVAIDSFSSIPGLTEANGWILSNPSMRTFFTTLAVNFRLLLSDKQAYKELCDFAADAFAPDPVIEGIALYTPADAEISGRMIPDTELSAQFQMAKHIFVYCLFLLWTDIDELSRNDEEYQLLAARSRAANIPRNRIPRPAAGAVEQAAS